MHHCTFRYKNAGINKMKKKYRIVGDI